jgi:hypothetical protein
VATGTPVNEKRPSASIENALGTPDIELPETFW